MQALVAIANRDGVLHVIEYEMKMYNSRFLEAAMRDEAMKCSFYAMSRVRGLLLHHTRGTIGTVTESTLGVLESAPPTQSTWLESRKLRILHKMVNPISEVSGLGTVENT